MADVLLGWGWQISGSDCSVPSPPAPFPLAGEGRLFHDHAAEHVSPETNVVIYSDAVSADNVERRRATELGIPTLSYFEMLGRLSKEHHTVAVAGTHGKSTTTAMIAHILVEAGRDPTVFCGATPLGKTSGGRAGGMPCSCCPQAGEGPGVSDQYSPTNNESRTPSQPALTLTLSQRARGLISDNALTLSQRARGLFSSNALTLTLSQRARGLFSDNALTLSQRARGLIASNDLMLVEACEYRANFLKLRPRQAAILNIEPDHFDCYDSLDEIENAFQRFAALVPPEGFLLVRQDCNSTRRATANAACRVESFGLSADADWSAQGVTEDRGRFAFEIQRFGQTFCTVRLQTPGRHNVLNALAAAALAYQNGVAAEQIAAGLESFAGLHRRLELLGMWHGVTVLDDYAHHPTEITATLDTVRRMFPRHRVWCVFQPHQASRTARLLDELADSLQNADRVLVAEIFRAREGNPQQGEITAADLARETARRGVTVLPGHEAKEIVEILETRLAPGDVLITLGAGDVTRLRPKMSEQA